MVQFIIEIIQRIKSSSPAFFVKLRKVMIVLGILIVCLQLLLKDKLLMPGAGLQQLLNIILPQSLVVIGAITGVSFLPTKDPKLIDSDTKQQIVKEAQQQSASTINNALNEIEGKAQQN